jgi:putative CocE/NonD family hydrolase
MNYFNRGWTGILSGAIIGLAFFTGARTLGQSPVDGGTIEMCWGVKIPMRDGVTLNATVFLPKNSGPVPVVFTLTPYIADSYEARATYFASHGYVFALVDVRGRGNSGGAFAPFIQEAKDGYDIVEWFAKQPWCDGKVAMWGGSYAGYDQWVTAREFPPHLSTIVPVASPYASIDFPMYRNIFYPYDMQWLTFTAGVTGNAQLFGDSKFWGDKWREMFRRHLPFASLDTLVGNPSPVFHEWLSHPHADAYWDTYNPTEEQYRRLSLPILTITGSYDADQAGALEHYRRHQDFGSRDATAQHYLIIGPWDHAGTRTPAKEIGGLTFGDAALLDLNALHRDWYDWRMKEGKRPEFLKNRVAYYVMGKDQWKYASSLDSVSTSRRTLFLSASGGGANDVFHSGSLVEVPANSTPPDGFTYDPLDMRPLAIDTVDAKESLKDQRFELDLHDNGLIYHTAPLTESIEVSGFVRVILYLSMDVPDTDLGVTLYEVLPDGSAIQLTSDSMRARFRDSLREEKLVTPGDINRYTFSGCTWFSRQIARGSRLRLVVSCINAPGSQKNYNSGGVVELESAKNARTAHVKLYHDKEHQSLVQLPVVR